MTIDKEKIYQAVLDSFDVIYYADLAEDRFEAVKIDQKLTDHFGISGSYR